MEIDVLGVELALKYDITDAADAEKLEAALDEFSKGLNEIEKEKGIRQSQLIRKEVACAKACLDEVCGEGAGEKVFADRENLKSVYVVSYILRNLNRLYMSDVLTDALKDALEQYSPERAKRKK